MRIEYHPAIENCTSLIPLLIRFSNWVNKYQVVKIFHTSEHLSVHVPHSEPLRDEL